MHRQTPTWLIVALSSLCSCLLMGSMMLGIMAWADGTELDSGPRTIPYNGVLEFNGESFTGPADIQFTLTDDGNCTFTEDHEEVRVFSGRFSVNIGQPTGDLPACLFNADAVYLEMSVRSADDDNPHVALAGRQRINPVPFAYWASEGSDFKIDGDIRVAADALVSGNARVGTTDVRPPSGQPRLELANNVDTDGINNFNDFQLMMWNSGSPTTSFGQGIQGATMFFNVPTGDKYMFYRGGTTELFELKGSLSTLNSPLDVTGALSSTGALSADSGSITNALSAGSLSVSGNATTSGTLSANAATISTKVTAQAWTPAYASWNAHGTGAGGAAIYNDSTHGLMIVGNGAHPDRTVQLYDDVTINGDLNVTGHQWGPGASTISYGNGANSQHNTHTNHTRSAICPNGQYMVGIHVIYGFHTNDNSSVGEIQAVCRSL